MKFLAGKPGEGAAKPRLGASLHIPGGAVKGAASAAFFGVTVYGHADP